MDMMNVLFAVWWIAIAGAFVSWIAMVCCHIQLWRSNRKK